MLGEMRRNDGQRPIIEYLCNVPSISNDRRDMSKVERNVKMSLPFISQMSINDLFLFIYVVLHFFHILDCSMRVSLYSLLFRWVLCPPNCCCSTIFIVP